MSRTKKYRPSLPAYLISHAIYLAKKDLSEGGSTKSAELISKLSPFNAKIVDGGITAAYELRPRESIEESLGMAVCNEVQLNYSVGGIKYKTKEAYWEACYTISLYHPEELSVTELLAAKEHKYLNGLMTLEEEAEFENQGDINHG